MDAPANALTSNALSINALTANAPTTHATGTQGTGAFHSTNLAEFIGGVVGLVLAASVVAFAMVLPMLLVRGSEK